MRIELIPYSRDAQEIERSLRDVLGAADGKYADDVYQDGEPPKGLIADLLCAVGILDEPGAWATEAFEQRFHAVRLVVGHGGVVAVVHGQVLDLHTEATGATLGATVLKELEQALDMLGVRLGEQVRVTDSGSNHALYRIRAGRRACPKARNTLYEKPIAGSGPVSRSRDSPQSLRDS